MSAVDTVDLTSAKANQASTHNPRSDRTYKTQALDARAGLQFTTLEKKRRAPAVDQCNGISNVGGQTVTCNVTITNNYTGHPATSSQTVCLDTGGTSTPVCTTRTGTPVTNVKQCDGAGNGGGGTVICAVTIVNNVSAGAAAALNNTTVLQCVGSGQGGGTEPTVICPPNTPGAPTPQTVNQCNGSGNGGGGSGRVMCTVTGDGMTLPVFVDQCNGSSNGGGAIVICTVSVTTNVAAGPGGGNGGDGTHQGGGPGNGGPPATGNPGSGTPVTGTPGTNTPRTPGTGTPGAGPPITNTFKTPEGTPRPPHFDTELPFTGLDLPVLFLAGAMTLLLGTLVRRIVKVPTR